METYCVSCKKKILRTKIRVLKKTRLMLYQIVLFVARKGRLSLKINNLMIFEKISLK